MTKYINEVDSTKAQYMSTDTTQLNSTQLPVELSWVELSWVL